MSCWQSGLCRGGTACWGTRVSSSLFGFPTQPMPCLASQLERMLKTGCISKS